MENLAPKALKMVIGLDLKGFEKMKAEEPENIFLLLLATTCYYLLDESYLDVKPDVDENLARKEDYKGVEKVKDDLDKLKGNYQLKFSEIKETEDVCILHMMIQILGWTKVLMLLTSRLFEEQFDENPKVEEGYDDGNAQEVAVN